MTKNAVFVPTLWFQKMILVDGIARSGKSLIASAFSAMPPFEPWQLPIAVDHVVKYLEMGIFSTGEARAALLVGLNSSTFDYAVGRGLNRRTFDQSSIYGTHANLSALPEREQNPDYSELIQASKSHNNTPVIVTHENIDQLSFWLETVPKIAVIEVIRNPTSLMVSWNKRSIVERWGTDPLMFVPCLDIKGQPVPVYAQDRLDEWLASDDLERLVLSTEIQYAKLIAAVKESSEDPLRRVRFVQIEQFKRHPTQTMEQLFSWLGVSFLTNSFSNFCELENLPRDSSDSQDAAEKKFLTDLLPTRLHSRVDRLLADYNSCVTTALENKAQYLI